MILRERLLPKEASILSKWFDILASSYPADTAAFLKRQRDPFANPVGNTSRETLNALYTRLLSDEGVGKADEILDPVIRIRAVQSFSPSTAVSFLFPVKSLIREALGGQAQTPEVQQALQTLDARVDELALQAFDIYMACREKIYRIQSAEERMCTYGGLRRAGLFTEASPAETPGEVND